ncbi:MAG: hypothetical protein QW731_04055 [Thermofilaceae archaeon]
MISSVNIVLRLHVTQREEGKSITLIPDNESRPCSKVSTTYESNIITTEVFCWCNDPVVRVRVLIDDVLRVLRIIENVALVFEGS